MSGKPKVWLLWVRDTSALVTLHAVALNADLARTMKRVVDTSDTVIESRIEEREANHLFNPIYAAKWEQIYGDILEQAAEAAELKAAGDRKRVVFLEEELRKVRESANAAVATRDAEIQKLRELLAAATPTPPPPTWPVHETTYVGEFRDDVTVDDTTPPVQGANTDVERCSVCGEPLLGMKHACPSGTDAASAKPPKPPLCGVTNCFCPARWEMWTENKPYYHALSCSEHLPTMLESFGTVRIAINRIPYPDEPPPCGREVSLRARVRRATP